MAVPNLTLPSRATLPITGLPCLSTSPCYLSLHSVTTTTINFHCCRITFIRFLLSVALLTNHFPLLLNFIGSRSLQLFALNAGIFVFTIRYSLLLLAVICACWWVHTSQCWMFLEACLSSCISLVAPCYSLSSTRCSGLTFGFRKSASNRLLVFMISLQNVVHDLPRFSHLSLTSPA